MVNNTLKGLRVSKGLNQTQMAEIIGIGITAYHNKETGKNEFTIEEIKKIVNYFGITFEEIFLHSNYSK